MTVTDAAKRFIHIHGIPTWAVVGAISALALAIILGAAILLVTMAAGKRRQ